MSSCVDSPGLPIIWTSFVETELYLLPLRVVVKNRLFGLSLELPSGIYRRLELLLLEQAHGRVERQFHIVQLSRADAATDDDDVESTMWTIPSRV